MGYETAVVGGLLGISFLWSFLAFNLKNQDDKKMFNDKSAIQLLLILMTFLSIAVILFVMVLIAQPNSDEVTAILETMYQAYTYVLLLVFAFYFIMFVIYLINMLKIKK